MPISDGADGVGSRRATSWSYVTAIVAAMTVIAYLAVWEQRYGLDLKVYRAAVDSWRSGQNPYLLTFTHKRLSFTYPPFALLVLSPLTSVSFPVAQWLLSVVSLAAATGSVVLIARDMGTAVTRRLLCGSFALSCFSFVALEPARSAVNYGQVGFILMFVVVADLLVMPPRYRGVGIGLVAAVKLTPLSFLILFVIGRDMRSVVRATATFLVAMGLPWLLWPRMSGDFWLHDVTDPRRVGTITYGGNQCWYAILHRPPFPANGSETLWLLLSLITLAAAAVIARRHLSAGQKAPAIVATALAGLLISPISWTHHWVWVLLIPALLPRHRTSGMPRRVRAMLWTLVALTIAAPYWWFRHGVPADVADAVLPVWTSAVLLVWSVTAVASRRGDPVPPTSVGSRATGAPPVEPAGPGVVTTACRPDRTERGARMVTRTFWG